MRQFVPSLVLIVPLMLGGSLADAQPSSPVPSPSKPADPFFLTRAKNLARQAAERQNGGLNAYRAEASMYGPAIDAPYVQNPEGSVTFTFKGGAPGFTTPTIETIAIVTSDGQVQLQYNGPLRNVAMAKVKPASPPPTQSLPPGPPIEKPVPIPVVPSTPTPESQAPIAPLPNTPDLPPLQSAEILPGIPSQVQQPPAAPLAQPVPSPADSRTPQTSATSIPSNNNAVNDLFLSRAKNLARQAAIKANGGLSKYRPESAMFGPAAASPHIKNQDGSITFKFRGGTPGYVTPTLESEVTITQNSDVTVTYNGPPRL